jgi:L-threonylcarbamoyladenylate synthase
VSYYTNKIDDKIVSLLKSGAIGLLPTDTIYGLSAVAMKKDAVEKIHNLKKRDDKKPLIVLVSSIKQFQLLGINDSQPKAIKKYWPGPLSVIFESFVILKWLDLGTKSLAVRMPDNKELLDLIKKTGPIVSSSANLQGQKPASSVKEAEEFFGSSLDFYVDVGPLEGQPSTLAKIENNQLIVIREGAYKKHLLKK